MDDLISRQAAIDEVQYEIEMINHALDSLTLDYNTREKLHQRKGEAREILNSIETLPSVDAAPVVRCKDCKYGEQDDYGWICTNIDGGIMGDENGNGFCCEGERRESNE